MILINLILILLVFHWIDIIFTILYIKKESNYYKNPEILEHNFHKYFWIKYGLLKGGIISGFVSSCGIVLSFFIIFTIENWIYLYFFVLGMLFLIAYKNFISWLYYDKIKKELIKR